MHKEFYFEVLKELLFWSQFLDCVMQNGRKGVVSRTEEMGGHGGGL